MSIWYQHNITVLAANREAVANFFNIDKENARTDTFELSFGETRGPGLVFTKIVEQHSDLIFIVATSVEVCDTFWDIYHFDKPNNQLSVIPLCRIVDVDGGARISVNEKLLSEYEKEFPGRAEKCFAAEHPLEWKHFFSSFEKAISFLNNADQYTQMINVVSKEDMEFDVL